MPPPPCVARTDQMTLKAIADTVDVVAGAIVIGSLAKWLPPIAAFFSIIWLVIRIGEWARVVIWKRPRR